MKHSPEKATPAGGGGPAGVVWATDNREEVKVGAIRRSLGGGWLRRNLLNWLSDRLAGDVRDVAAGQAQVVEFAGRKAVQLIHGFPVATPVAVIADQVHLSSRDFVVSSVVVISK